LLDGPFSPIYSDPVPLAPSTRRKADEVASDLLRRIVSGDLAVGTLLSREADLARTYGVGRSLTSTSA
jgi:DNA-binding FadR family transcriptional regulator